MDLLEAIRQELIDQELVRKPSVPGTEPPMWLEPRDGAPAPGEGNNPTARGSELVVSAFLSGGIPTERHEGFLRVDAVDFWIRAVSAPVGVAFEHELRDALNDKRGWEMAGSLTVHESLQIRPLQRLGADEQGFTYITEYSFETWQ